MAGFVRRDHPNTGGIIKRTHIFADTAADAFFRVHFGQLDPPFFPFAELDLGLHAIDGLFRNRAVLFAHHAIPAVHIGNAAGHIEGGQTDLDLVFFLFGQRSNRLCWAYMSAGRAGVIAVSDDGHQVRCEKAFQAGFRNGRLQATSGAYFHAHATGRAAGEEVRLGSGTGWADEPGMID